MEGNRESEKKRGREEGEERRILDLALEAIYYRKKEGMER